VVVLFMLSQFSSSKDYHATFSAFNFLWRIISCLKSYL
jgi:hypothetical protein